MGRVVLGLLFLVSASSCASADGSKPVAAVSRNNVVALVPSEKIVSGRVESFSVADMAKGTKSEIVLADASGKKTEVLVTPTTTLYDADAQAITLNKITLKDKVNVIYTTSPEDVNEAKLVKVIK